MPDKGLNVIFPIFKSEITAPLIPGVKGILKTPEANSFNKVIPPPPPPESVFAPIIKFVLSGALKSKLTGVVFEIKGRF